MRSFDTILITGACGAIGSEVLNWLKLKYPSTHFINLDALTYAGREDHIEPPFDNYTFAYGDVCDSRLVAYLLDRHRPQGLIHFAAETHVDNSFGNSLHFTRANVLGTHTLLECVHKYMSEGNDFRLFLHMSTDEVYGHIHGDHRSTESDNLAPRSPYAASKAGGDHMAAAYWITYGLPVTISRGANNIGPFQYPEKVVPLFVTNALADLALPVYGDGRQMRDYQHVLDHCAGIDVVLQRGEIGQTYNIGTGREMTNLEMVEILLDELGKPRSLIQHVEDRQGHDRRYCMNVDKLMALGWEPGYTHEAAIRATVRWYVDNRWWWEPIRSGEFQDYYQRLYGQRKVIG